MTQSPLHLSLVLVAVFAVLPGCNMETMDKVWGHVGQARVVLPCESRKNEAITNQQWEKQAPVNAVNNSKLVVHDVTSGQTNTFEPYKDKLEWSNYSLVIKNVNVEDSGVYICTLNIFPSGKYQQTTSLEVNDQMPLSAGVVSATVISVLLLLGIISATLYFAVIRRSPSSSRNLILIDTQNAVRDPSRPSLLKREDTVYEQVEGEPSNQSPARMSEDHVTYAKVKRARHDGDVLYSQVMRI
ncbi:unnamed protein product [Knipowitschia caucasica]|uniref:Ig-like domain-containing protein n=1 Tax=Knipowitschia caucasica TaxID=637954 RepID=A0AAV2MAU2_KNICA